MLWQDWECAGSSINDKNQNLTYWYKVSFIKHSMPINKTKTNYLMFKKWLAYKLKAYWQILNILSLYIYVYMQISDSSYR